MTGLRARQPAQPVRTCVGCRQRASRSELLRVVVARGDAAVSAVPDPGARLPGRGAWLHPDPACLDLAERRRALGRALRQQGPLDATAVRDHLQQRPAPAAPPPAPPAAADTPTTVDEHESGTSPDGHPMSSSR